MPVKLITYPGPGPLADDIKNLDIGNIANETERAKTISFSSAYCNIQATYLVPPDSEITSIQVWVWLFSLVWDNHVQDVDRAGVRIVTKARSAYDLWLTENIRNAEIVRFKTVDESFRWVSLMIGQFMSILFLIGCIFSEFQDKGYEVLSGLRPKLLDQSEKMPGSRILDGSFTVIGQSVGCNKGD